MNEVVDLAPAARPMALATPGDLVLKALEQGADLDRLERLMTMQREWEAHEARKAFVQAMTAFKAEPIEIFKRKEVAFLDVRYKHAELSDVTAAVTPAMSKHGLSFTWDVKQEGRRIVVHCIVTHHQGHSERVTMEGEPDASGKKNPIQAVGSTVAYLQRYTLLAATGMSTKGDDTDGRPPKGDADGDEPDEQDAPLIQAGHDAALGGMKVLTTWWGKTLNEPQRKRLTPEFASMREAARKADAVGVRA